MECKSWKTWTHLIFCWLTKVVVLSCRVKLVNICRYRCNNSPIGQQPEISHRLKWRWLTTNLELDIRHKMKRCSLLTWISSCSSSLGTLNMSFTDKPDDRISQCFAQILCQLFEVWREWNRLRASWSNVTFY